MPMNQDNQFDAQEPEEKSKTQIKREMEALQKLGERLTAFNKEQLSQIPLDENIAAAVHEYQRLKKREAKRRQLQYIGRLMRDTDAEAISQAVHRFDASHTEHTRHFHQIESWRERLLNESTAVTEFVSQYPSTDVQALRQLIRKAQKEQSQGKDLGGARKLFRHIREIIEQ